jgi:hypothetical protein
VGDAIGGGVDPGEGLRLGQELLRLNLAELGERPPGRLITVAKLAGRGERIQSMHLRILIGRLVGVDHDLVARLPALDPRADLPDDPRRVRATDVVAPPGVVPIGEDRDRIGQRRPDAVEVEARRHYPDDDLERPWLGNVDLLDLVSGRQVSLALGA